MPYKHVQTASVALAESGQDFSIEGFKASRHSAIIVVWQHQHDAVATKGTPPVTVSDSLGNTYEPLGEITFGEALVRDGRRTGMAIVKNDVGGQRDITISIGGTFGFPMRSATVSEYRSPNATNGHNVAAFELVGETLQREQTTPPYSSVRSNAAVVTAFGTFNGGNQNDWTNAEVDGIAIDERAQTASGFHVGDNLYTSPVDEAATYVRNLNPSQFVFCMSVVLDAVPTWEPIGGEVGAWVPSHDGTWKDQVGSNDGTPSGGVDIQLDRERGGVYAGVFPANGSWVDAGNLGAFNRYTVVASVYATQSSTQLIFNAGTNSPSTSRCLNLAIENGGQLLGGHQDSTNASRWAISDSPIPLNQWNELAVSYDGATVRVYVNGVVDGSLSTTQDPGPNADITRIGSFIDSGNPLTLIGKIDDCRVWKKALDPAEIAELYKRNYQRRIRESVGLPTAHYSPTRNKHYSETFWPDISSNGENTVDVTSFASIVNDSRLGGRKAMRFESFNRTLVPLRTLSGDWTIEFFAEQDTANNEGMICGDSTVTTTYMWLSSTWSGFRYQVPGYAVTFPLSAEQRTTLGHYAFVSNETENYIELFRDGVSVNRIDSPNAAAFSFILDNIGNGQTGNTNALLGIIDDFRTHDRALPTDEIKLYSGSRSAIHYERDPLTLAVWHPTQDHYGQRVGSESLNLTLKGYNGLLEGGATYDTTNKEENGEAALSFSGIAGEWLRAPLTPMTTAGTISFWCRPNRTATDASEALFAHVGGGGNFVTCEKAADGSVLAGVLLSGQDDRVSFSPTAEQWGQGEWRHWVVTWDADATKVYIQGVEVASGPGTAGYAAEGNLRFGDNGFSSPFSGLMDAMRFENWAWPAEHVKRVYALKRWGRDESYNATFGTGQSAESAGLLMHLPQQESDSGTTAKDIVLNDYPGTTSTQTSAMTGVGPTSYLPNALQAGPANTTQADIVAAINDVGKLTIGHWSKANAGYQNVTHGAEEGVANRCMIQQFSDGKIYFVAEKAAETYPNINDPAPTDYQSLAMVFDGERTGWDRVAGYINGVRQVLGIGGSVPPDTLNIQPQNWKVGLITANGGYTASVFVIQDALADSQIAETSTGPEAILTGTEPVLQSTPTVGQECFVDPGGWEIDPEFSGNNGDPYYTLYFYLQDDATGGGRDAAPVAVVRHGQGYTPAAEDEGRYLTCRVVAFNDGGADTLEVWWTPAEVVEPGVTGIVVELGIASESDTAQTLTVDLAPLIVPLGIASETNTAPALTPVVTPPPTPVVSTWEPLGGERGAWVPSHNKTWNDQTPNGNDGTPSGGVDIQLDRERGGVYAGVFDGQTGSYVQAPVTDVGATTDPWSLAVWAKPNDLSGGRQAIMLAASAGAEGAALGFRNSGTWSFENQNQSNAVRSSVSATVGRWDHIAATWDGANLRLYVNGEADGVGNAMQAFNVARLFIGSYTPSFGFFSGDLDDGRLWNRVLDPAEVAELYKRNYQRRIRESVGLPAFHASPTRNKHYSDTFLPDLSGNAASGTLNSGVTVENNSENGGRKALLSDGVSGSYVTVANDAAFAFDGTKPFSVRCWVNPQTSPSFQRIVAFSEPGRGQNRGWLITADAGSGKFNFLRGNAAGNDYLPGAGQPTVGQWAHVAATYDGATMRLYADGSTPLTLASTRALDTVGGELRILGTESNDLAFNALADDVAIDSRVLSHDEIKLYSGSRSAEHYERDPLTVWVVHPTQDAYGVNHGSEALDLTLNGYNFNAENGATYNTTDKEASGEAAMYMPGTTDGQFRCSTSPLGASGTISCWVKASRARTDANNETFIRHAGGGSRFWSLVKISDGSMYAGVSQPGQDDRVFFTPTDQQWGQGEWRHWAVTWDANATKVYNQGVEIASGPGTLGYEATANMRLGDNGLNAPFLGLMDAVRFEGRALKPLEIEQEFNRQRWGRDESYNATFGTGQSAEAASLETHLLCQDAEPDTNVVDSSSYKRTSQVVGGKTTAALSTTGSTPFLPFAFALDGVVDAINVPHFDSATQMTLWSRCRLNTNSETLNIIGFGHSSTRYFRTWLKGDVSKFSSANFHQTGPTYEFLEHPTTALTDQWYNVAGVFAQNYLAISVDDDRSEITPTINFPPVNENINIGRLDFGTIVQYFDGIMSECAILSDALADATIAEANSGPEAILTGTEPVLQNAPTVGEPCYVQTDSTQWDIDPEFDGQNGETRFTLYYYLQDDADGGGRDAEPVAVVRHPEGYTPAAEDEGRYLTCRVLGWNDGGYDTLEVWWTPAEVVAPATGAITVPLSAATETDSAPSLDIQVAEDEEPENIVPPAVSGTPEVGETLTYTQGEWISKTIDATIGQSGTDVGVRISGHPQPMGTFHTTSFRNTPIYSIESNTGTFVVKLRFGANGDQQAGGSTAIRLRSHDGAQEVTATWNGSEYQVVDMGMTGYLTAQNGNRVDLSLTTESMIITGQWQRSTQPDGSDAVNIVGQTGPTYTLQPADQNQYVSVLETATDDAGSNQERSNVVGPIIGVAIIVPLDPATEQDSAANLTIDLGKLTVVLGLATETDSAPAIDVSIGATLVPISPATETDSAPSLAISFGTLEVSIGVATETDSAPALSFVEGLTLGVATETDSAPALAISFGTLTVPLGVATENDSAPALALSFGAITVPLGVATETDSAPSLAIDVGSTLVTLSPATELDTAKALKPQVDVDIPLQPATESDSAPALEISFGTLQVPLSPAGAVDSAPAIIIAFGTLDVTLSPPVAIDRARTLSYKIGEDQFVQLSRAIALNTASRLEVEVSGSVIILVHQHLI